MIGQRFFLTICNLYVSRPLQGALLCVEACLPQAGSLQLCPSLQFLLVQSLKSDKGERLRPIQVFPQHVCSLRNLHNAFQIPRNVQKPSAASMNINSSALSFRILVTVLFAPIITHLSDSLETKQLTVIVFTSALRKKSVSTGRTLSQAPYRQPEVFQDTTSQVAE